MVDTFTSQIERAPAVGVSVNVTPTRGGRGREDYAWHYVYVVRPPNGYMFSEMLWIEFFAEGPNKPFIFTSSNNALTGLCTLK